MKCLPTKRLADGRAMLNLGCGGHMHAGWNNVDFSPLVRLARHRRLARILNVTHILSDKRFERLRATDTGVICWDLRRGIPFADNSFDVVYHSHFLEHLTQKAARHLLHECRRVLKLSGILRVVVPDLESSCREYLESCTRLRQSPTATMEQHESSIHAVIAQMVAGEPAGTSEQPLPVRLVERLVRGDRASAGEAHRWMYDCFTIRALLESIGFSDIRLESASSSHVEGWQGFGLDTNDDGSVYKPQSLYVEAVK